MLLPIALAAILVTATKIAFMGFGWGIARIDFTGLSGHAMLAAAIYPVLVVVFVSPTHRRRAAGAAAAALVGIRGRFSRRDGRPFGIGSAQRIAVGALAAAIATRSIDRAGGVRLSFAWLTPGLVWMLLTLPAPPVMQSRD